MTSNDLARRRFEDASWFKRAENSTVAVLGAGGVGSHLTFGLSRLGIKQIFIIDFDEFAVENFAGQLFLKDTLGNKKVSSVKGFCESVNSNLPNIIDVPSYFDDIEISCDVIFSCVDSMAGRKIAFDKFLANPYQKLFVDARLNAEFLQIFTIDKSNESNVQRYQTEFLFRDEDVEDAICTFKQTTHFAQIISGMMVNVFTNWCDNQNRKEMNKPARRKLPFKIEFEGLKMNYELCI